MYGHVLVNGSAFSSPRPSPGAVRRSGSRRRCHEGLQEGELFGRKFERQPWRATVRDKQSSSIPAARRAGGWARGRRRASARTLRTSVLNVGLLTCRVVFVVLRSVSYPLRWAGDRLSRCNKMYLVAIWCRVFAISATRMRQRTEKRHNRGAFRTTS